MGVFGPWLCPERKAPRAPGAQGTATGRERPAGADLSLAIVSELPAAGGNRNRSDCDLSPRES